jgi:hypothetical protein
MARLNSEWIVGPHGPVQQLGDGLLTVAGEIRMPLGNFPRRMSAIRLRNGSVAVWSAMAIDNEALARIEAMGPIGFLIVPGIAHRLDLIAWRRRHADAQILCAPGARKAVEEAAHVDSIDDILDDPDVKLRCLPGTGETESALIVRRAAGTSLILNDVLANVRHPHGLGARLMARLFGFGRKRPQMPRLIRHKLVTDRPELAKALRELSGLPNLKRIIVSHGDVISQGPEAILKRVAKDLA